MHDWSDETVDWAGIDNAANYISNYLKRWGRITAHGKEKYGTVRIDFLYFGYGLHQIIWPGCLMLQWPKRPKFVYNFLTWFDYDVWQKGLQITRIYKLIFKYQAFIYRRAYRNAVKKWPHLRQEILCHAEHEILGLDPREFGWTTYRSTDE